MRILGEELSVALFMSIFIVSLNGDFDLTYALSGVDRKVKAKFKGSFSKVCN